MLEREIIVWISERGIEMKRVEEIVREALIEEGIMKENWRFTVCVESSGYEFVRLEVEVYEPRCRKPVTIWYVPYSTFRNLLYWSEAELAYNKYWNV